LCPVGLLKYCNFGQWTAEEDEQLKKNFAEIVKVCMAYFHYCHKDTLNSFVT